jgi:hypothetical protein
MEKNVEVVVPSWDLRGGIEENHEAPVRIYGVPIEIRTEQRPNIRLDYKFCEVKQKRDLTIPIRKLI